MLKAAINAIQKVYQDIFTGIDNQTHVFAKYAWFGSMATIVAVTAHLAWSGKTVDVIATATALGIIATTHGAVIWGTKSTEPPVKPKEDEEK